MLKELKCKICGANAMVHGYQRSVAIATHMEVVHPEVYAEAARCKVIIEENIARILELTGSNNWQMFFLRTQGKVEKDG